MDKFPTIDELSVLVHDYFDSHGREVCFDPEVGMGNCGDAEFSVHNLAANLASIDRKHWPEYVAWHFGHVLEGGPPKLPSTYPKARRRLRVRLASERWVDALPYQELTRPVAEDLHEVLMVSIDDAAVTVPPHSFAEWGEPLDRLWNDARENTLWEEPRERRSLLSPTGERITWVRGSWWVASLLLDLGRYLSPHSVHGALAMVPVRDALLYHEIADERAVTSLGAMVQVGLRFHFDGPDPISPHVYWWRGGEIRQVVSYEEERLNPVWGADFKQMLADLEASIDWGQN